MADALAAAALSMAQAYGTTRRELQQAAALAEGERLQAARHHETELRHSVGLFNEHSGLQWEAHEASMTIAVDLATRETMRDVWQQRQFLNQTVLMVDALMFSCAFMSISQPQITDDLPLPAWLGVVFAATTGAGVFLLMLSMWAAFKLQSRMGGFNVSNSDVVYVCGNKHAEFNNYYSCHCETLRITAVAAFFVGTVAVLLSAVSVHTIQSLGRFGDPVAAAVFAGVLLAFFGGTVALELLAPDATERPADYGGLTGEAAGTHRPADAPPSATAPM